MSRRALLALLALAATWGASYLLIAIALESFSPAFLTEGRFLLGALLVTAVAARRGDLRALRGRWRAVALLALVQQAAPMLLIAVGERSIPSALAGTLVASTPLWAAVLAPALGGPRPAFLQWTGLAIGIVGVGLLLGADTSGAAIVGCALVLLAAAGYAVGAAWTGRRFPTLPRSALLSGVLISSTALLLPPALATAPTQLPSLASLAAVVALGLVGTGAAFIVLYWLIDQVGPERTVLVTYLAPVFAVGYGATLADETFGTAAVVGLALVLAGAYLAGRRTRLTSRALALPEPTTEPATA
jgi:drug/metabolite transporter (DMT)-like permease